MADTPNELNLFTDYTKSGRYLNRSLGGENEFRTKNSKIISFPPGLGGQELSTDVNRPIMYRPVPPIQTIPFTIFAPYKRKKLTSGLYSTQIGGTVFENLPQPWFAIALPTPSSALKATYSATYSEPDIGQGLGAISSSIMGSIDSVIKSAKDRDVTGVLKNVWDGVTGATGDATGLAAFAGIQKALNLSPGTNPDVLNIIAGAASNPYTETVFKNVEFRTHSFDYVFMPRNRDESKTIDEIIQLFKYTMLPQQSEGLEIASLELSTGSGFFQFPYEFQITHSTQDTTFTLLPSVLSSLSVDYSGGTDTPKFFVPNYDKSQYPARITLTMQFKEMILLTRDRLDVPSGVSNYLGTTEDADYRGNTLRFRF